MTAINVIFPDAEAWLKENFRDLTPDNICPIVRETRWKFDGETLFTDYEDESHPQKNLTMADFVKALDLLSQQLGRTLFVGGLKNPVDLVDPCNWDAEVVDALYQLAFYGEVIYG